MFLIFWVYSKVYSTKKEPPVAISKNYPYKKDLWKSCLESANSCGSKDAHASSSLNLQSPGPKYYHSFIDQCMPNFWMPYIWPPNSNRTLLRWEPITKEASLARNCLWSCSGREDFYETTKERLINYYVRVKILNLTKWCTRQIHTFLLHRLADEIMYRYHHDKQTADHGKNSKHIMQGELATAVGCDWARRTNTSPDTARGLVLVR